MSESIDQSLIREIVHKVNVLFDVHLDDSDFKSAQYSVSSLRDLLLQKTEDEKNGQWTTDVAFHRLRKGIASVTGTREDLITPDSSLDQLFPAGKRRADIKRLQQNMGISIDILKPHPLPYGFFIFCFFAGIPMFSIGVFQALLTFAISAVIIFILLKTGNRFKVKTVGHFADHLAWKNYLKDKSSDVNFDKAEASAKLKLYYSPDYDYIPQYQD